MSSSVRRRPIRTPHTGPPPAGRSRSRSGRPGIPPALTWGFVGVLLDFVACAVAAALYGIALAGYVPISALVPALAPRHKGQAMSALNLGAGASTFAGPAVVAVALGPVGVQGIAWIFALLHLATAVAIRFLEPDPEFTAPPTEPSPAPAADGTRIPAGRH
ncbi:MFS transporter [Streptomyces lydicamycinicus]